MNFKKKVMRWGKTRPFILCTSSATTFVAKVFHYLSLDRGKERLISSEISFWIVAEYFCTVNSGPRLYISHISSALKFYLGADDANEAPASKATAGVHQFQTRSCVFLNPFQTIA